MPLYEYQCGCGNSVEILQKVGADAPRCGTCALDKMTRKVSRTSFSLKGSGWAKDNYGLKANSD